MSYIRTPEIREKNRQSAHRDVIGHPCTEETKAKIGAANKGHTVSEEARMKIGLAGRGRVGSQAQKDAVRKALLGIPRTEETKAKISAAHKGKSMLPHVRLALIAANTGRVQSAEVNARRSAKLRGENSPSWKGGVTPIAMAIRWSKAYDIWRTTIFVRDDYTCQKCGERGGKLVAHHMDGFADFPEKRFDADNAATLCKKCHDEFGRLYGTRHNRKWQTDEFLSIGTKED